MTRARSGRWTVERGERDYRDLGGLGLLALYQLDSADGDAARKRMMAAWFGTHGARYAWGLYDMYRRAPLHRYLRTDDEDWQEADLVAWVQAQRECDLQTPAPPIDEFFHNWCGWSRTTGRRLEGRAVRRIVAVVGSRRWPDRRALLAAQEQIETRLGYGDTPHFEAVVSGDAYGIDRLGQDVGAAMDLVVIKHKPTKQQWSGVGGYQWRNKRIAAAAAALLCITSPDTSTFGAGWTADYAENILHKIVERIGP